MGADLMDHIRVNQALGEMPDAVSVRGAELANKLQMSVTVAASVGVVLAQLHVEGLIDWTPAVDRNIVTDEQAERNRTVSEGGYTFHAPVAPGTFGAVIVVACVRLGDHAHIDIDTGVAVPTPFSTRDPELRRGSAGHLIMAWPDWILFRSILANSPIVHIAEVENPTRGQIGFHTRDDREAQIARLLEQRPDMEVWFR